MTRRIFLVFLLVLSSAVVSSQGAPLTNEILVGAAGDADHHIRYPDVAALGGGFVVTWSRSYFRYSGSRLIDQGAGISGRIVAADGALPAGEIPLVPEVSGRQIGRSAVASNADDRFAVVWQDREPNASPFTTWLRELDATGAEVATSHVDSFPSLGSFNNNDAVVTYSAGSPFAAWIRTRSEAARSGPNPTTLFAHLDETFQVTPRGGILESPSISSGGRGETVLVYASHGPRGNTSFFARFYDAAGRARGGDLRLPLPAPATQPVVAARADGRFVVAWQEEGKVWARLFDPSARPLFPPALVNPGTPVQVAALDVAVDSRGRFVVIWLESDANSEYTPRIKGRACDAQGRPSGNAFRVDRNHQPPWHFRNLGLGPAVAAGPAGTFLVTWSTWEGEELGKAKIFARLYAF